MRQARQRDRANFPTRAAFIATCTAASSGPCGSSPDSPPPEETNRRYHYLLEQGQTGLSVAFDLPTLMGYDADHAMSEGEVGKCGVSICSLEDMEILFRGIPLGDVTVSMTINSPAAGALGHVPGGGRTAGRGLGAALRAPCRTTF